MRFVRLSICLGLAVALFAGCQSASTNTTDAILFDLMAQRLEVARDVAWSKFNSGAPVLDPAREQVVLEAFVSQAARAGLDPRAATAFFTAQLAASRAVQTEMIAAWQRGAPRPFGPPLDLATNIRPRLDAIGAKLVPALAARPPPASDPQRLEAARRSLEGRAFSANVARLAAEGLVLGVR